MYFIIRQFLLLILLVKEEAMMSESKRKKIEVDRKKEMRTKEISKMISEGGLGADRYYKIEKNSKEKKEQ